MSGGRALERMPTGIAGLDEALGGESSRVGAAVGAANLAVVRKLRGADLAPRKAGASAVRSTARGKR